VRCGGAGKFRGFYTTMRCRPHQGFPAPARPEGRPKVTKSEERAHTVPITLALVVAAPLCWGVIAANQPRITLLQLSGAPARTFRASSRSLFRPQRNFWTTTSSGVGSQVSQCNCSEKLLNCHSTAILCYGVRPEGPSRVRWHPATI